MKRGNLSRETESIFIFFQNLFLKEPNKTLRLEECNIWKNSLVEFRTITDSRVKHQ